MKGSDPFTYLHVTTHGLLVFEHIPKTAGTTFRRSYLTAALPSAERWILGGGETNARDRDRFLSLPAAKRDRDPAVADALENLMAEQHQDQYASALKRLLRTSVLARSEFVSRSQNLPLGPDRAAQSEVRVRS